MSTILNQNRRHKPEYSEPAEQTERDTALPSSGIISAQKEVENSRRTKVKKSVPPDMIALASHFDHRRQRCMPGYTSKSHAAEEVHS